MDWKFIIALVIASIIGWLLRSYFGSYAKKKAENLATKQDIGEITRTVEEVKSNLATSLELIKWELGKKATIHRLAAESEFKALTEIAKHLYEIQLATENLRPTWIQRADLTKQKRKKERNIGGVAENGQLAMTHSRTQSRGTDHSCLNRYTYASLTLGGWLFAKLAISTPLAFMEREESPRVRYNKLRKTSWKCRRRSMPR